MTATVARRVPLAALGILLMAGAGLADGYVTPPLDAFVPVTVELRNESPAVLRCVVVLAHFITRNAAPVAPGGGLSLAFERQSGSGALAYGSHAGAPMLVENLLCGRDDDWDGTRVDIPLTAIRVGDASGYVIACRLEERFFCAIEPGGPAE